MINRLELLKAVEVVMPAIGEEEGMGCLLFSENMVYAYNGAMVMASRANMDGLEGVVNAKDFYAYLKRLKMTDMNIVKEDNSWKIKCGSSRAEINMYDVDVNKIKAICRKQCWKPLPEKFSEYVSLANITPNNHIAAGIFIDSGNMYCTDAKRVSYIEMGGKMNGVTLWLNPQSTKALIGISSKLSQYSISDSWIHFASENKKLILSIKKQDTVKYPIAGLNRIIKEARQEPIPRTSPIPSELIDAVSNSLCFSTIDNDGEEIVDMVINPEYAEVRTSKQSGSYAERVKWTKKVFIKDTYLIRVNGDFIVWAMKNADGFYVISIEDKKQHRLIFPNKYGMMIVQTMLKGEEDNDGH